MLIWIGALALGGFILTLVQARMAIWSVAAAAWIAAGWGAELIAPTTAAIMAAAAAPVLLLLTLTPLRRAILSRSAMAGFRRIMPKMSPTEQAAVEAGGVWWDAELFAGKPDWKRLLATPAPVLTPEEQSFLDNEAEHLCDLANDWETTSVWQDLSPEAWAYAKDKGFLGMIIPKAYGGLGFSAYAHSQVIQKLSTRCSAAAVSVMVPNSLGPAELLLHYGTDEQ